MIAALRPHAWDFPLFLHVFGAIVLFGSILATVALSFAGWRMPVLARSAFWALLAGAVPAWVLMRVGAGRIYSKEHDVGLGSPTWVGIGYGVADAGLVVLLLATGFAFWWQRSGKLVAARVVAGLSSLYLVMLAIAWLAMSGKWS